MIAGSSYRWYAIFTFINIVMILGTIYFAPPAPFGPGADLIAFEIEYRTTLLAGNYLGVIQLLLGLYLMVFLVQVIREAEARSGGWLWIMVLSFSITFGAMFMMVSFFFSMPPLIIDQGIVPLRLLTQLGLYGLGFQNAFQAVLMAVIAIATLRLRFLPPWMGWAAWVAAILSWLGTLGLFGSNALAQHNFTLLIAGMAQHVWQVLSGIYWLARPPAAKQPVPV